MKYMQCIYTESYIMFTFIINFIHRSLSGLQNASGYSERKHLLTLTTFLLSTMSLIFIFYLYEHYNLLSALLMIPSLVAALGVNQSFYNKRFLYIKPDIHFFELILTSSFNLAFIATLDIHNIIFTVCSVYPALILHKGLTFFDNRTDDPAGKTFSIPVLNLSIPRSTTRFRLIAAAVSIVIFLVMLLF